MLVHIPHVLNAQLLADVRRKLDAADWTDGRETVGAQGAEVKRNRQLPDTSPLKAELGRAVLQALAASPLFHAAALPVKILPPRFNLYSGGGEYGFHVDGAVMRTEDGQQLRSDLSCTIFLNDPEDYDGGDLVISDTYGDHAISLAAGDAILYPSSSLHRVTPVTRGARLGCFFWVQSMVRDDAQRRMLFELDATIQRLTADGAAREPLLQLTSLYHNLLRGWAEL